MKEILQKTSMFFDSNDLADVAQRTQEADGGKKHGDQESLLHAYVVFKAIARANSSCG
jgi:hypothetical protein